MRPWLRQVLLAARPLRRAGHANPAAGEGTVIFHAVTGRAIRLLKLMSVAGSAVACTATGAALAAQSLGTLGDDDLSVASLAAASSVSVASTLAITRMFGPFVTRITLLPPGSGAAVRASKSGLPRFDAMLAAPKAGPVRAARPLLSGQVTNDSVLVLESPGFLGYTTRVSRVAVSDLVPAAQRYRTWNLSPASLADRKARGIPTPLTTFTVMWKSSPATPARRMMEEVNSLVGPL
ncbi:hypothetical protein H4R18_000148 [Coemansia javaensis]|uniref:Uncharacterized protein n=1 Tax=Coemansia javaensis TaxID=2761396 RepID=A0A9W8HNM5_9FUNG|nr:hypothetical protein H4R18_000148 [Coemansia javaensis]